MKSPTMNTINRCAKITFTLVLSGVFAACAVMNSPHEPLPTVESATLNLPAASGQTLAQWPHEGWWRAYNDATLNRLIEQALADGPSLQVLAKRAQTALQNADAVRKAHFPAGQIKATWTGQKFINGELTDYTQQLAPVLLAKGMDPSNLPDQGMKQTDVSAGFSWDLDLWGKNRAAYNAALGQSRAQQLEYEAARQGVVTQIVSLHANIAALQSRQAILRQMIGVQSTLKQRWLEREQAGLQPVQNSLQTDLALAQLEQMSAGLNAQHEAMRAQLAALVGLTPAQLPAIESRSAWVSLNLPNRLTTQILGTRADLAAAREYINAASAQVESVRAEFYPDLNLSLFAGLQIIGLDDLVRFSGQNVGVKPALTLPLFSSVQLNAKLRIQQAQLDTAIAQYNKTVLEAISDSAQQLAQLQQARSHIQQQNRIVNDYQKLSNLAQQRYRSGMTPQMESLMTMVAYLREQDALYAAFANRRMQEARLANSLGVGFSDFVHGNGTPTR